MAAFEKGNTAGKGRPPGSKNKRTIGRELIEELMLDSAMLPLEYQLKVLNDPDSEEGERRWASEKAAPYCHSKAPEDKTITIKSAPKQLMDYVNGTTTSLGDILERDDGDDDS